MDKKQFTNKKLKIENAFELANLIRENKIVVIKISASWCGPCKNANFLKLYEEVKNNFIKSDNVKFVELDVDAHSDIIENKEYFDISIDSVPTFLLSKDGCFVKKYSGTSYLEIINNYIIENL